MSRDVRYEHAFSSELAGFLSEFWETGVAQVTCPATVDPVLSLELEELQPLILDLEASYRLGLPADPPSLDVPSALWAAEKLYRACQAVVCRDYAIDMVRRLLERGHMPDRSLDTSHYSVDVFLRHLPGVIARARATAESDPVVEILLSWCTDWPLSSVGVPDVAAIDIEPLHRSAGLFKIYLNRIVTQQDRSRARDPRVQSALRAAAGQHQHLLSDLLEEQPK